MDYNKDDKGFVCAVYRITQKRIVYVSFALFVGILALILNTMFFIHNDAFGYLLISFFILTISPMLIALNPKIFILKLCGFLASLGSILVLLHNLSKLKADATSSVFEIYFIVVATLGFIILGTLLSWFVYNARSSEVNNI